MKNAPLGVRSPWFEAWMQYGPYMENKFLGVVGEIFAVM